MVVAGTEDVPWVAVDPVSGLIRCERCGVEHPFRALLPMSIAELVRVCRERCDQHRGCKAKEEP